jgi:uncharacterized membrane protein YdbT with pleckstrin-like domain
MPTEPALDTFRPSTVGWLKGTLAGWGTALLFIAGIVLAVMGTFDLGLYWLVLSVVAIGLFVWRWLENLASKYELTEERLIIRRGLIAKSLDEIELYRIKDVRINYSIINQIAGIGTISISSSDETTRDGDLVIRDVERARPRREEIRRLVDIARQKRRVREVDMVHEDMP